MKRTELLRKTPLRARTAPMATTTLARSTTRMRQGRSTGKPTTDEARRLVTIKALGCICCMLNRQMGMATAYYGPCDAHHLLSGGRRRGHECTIGLCDWHHEAKPPYDAMGAWVAIATFGPSVATGSKPFHAMYGTDDELLEFQDALLAAAKELVL
jgi:hypothetical protein